MEPTLSTTAGVVPPATAVAEFRGARYAYGATVAVADFDLTVRPGEVVAVLGPNGAGKTTALHLLMGLLAPRSGTVRLFGANPRERAARERLGVMLQVSGVPETPTVREHLRGYAAYYPAPLPVDEVIATAGLGGVARRPYGKLSGGQRQRLHLALALVGDPDLLVLDEPTAGLDAATAAAWAFVALAIAVFLPVYFWTWSQGGTGALPGILILAAMGVLGVQVNSGSAAFLIYAAAATGTMLPTRLAIRTLVALLALVVVAALTSGILHDLLGHTLSVIVLKSELASKLAAAHPERAAEAISRLGASNRAEAARKARERGWL